MKTRTLCLGLAALALLGTPSRGAFAQGSMSASMPADPDAIDYSALNNSHYTYVDLTLAKARDFSDTKIAKLVKISEVTGTPFSVLSDALIDGKTYYALSEQYGFSLANLDDVQKQKDEVSNYISAYETSGQYGYPNK